MSPNTFTSLHRSIVPERAALRLGLYAGLLCFSATAWAAVQEGAREASPAVVHASPAGGPPAAALEALRDTWETSVLYDEPGDGSLWARGQSYKFGFDAAGATFYPALGPNAPRNYPHRLSPDLVTIGGEALSFASESAPRRVADRVELERGTFVEAYDFALDSVEQTFVFASLPSREEIVVHIPIASDFPGISTDEGLEFRGELGSVKYGRAVAIDADGARAEAPVTLAQGSITIRVPAEFVRNAALPLVIDPVVGSVYIDSTTFDTLSPDVAWEPFHNGWLVVYEQVYSDTDHDVYARFLSPAGLTISSFTVDLSSSNWSSPRVANLAAYKQFLVVANVTESLFTHLVKGRTVQPAGTILIGGSQFIISAGGTGGKYRPDVGGDPYPSEPSYFCVAYEHSFSDSDKRIAVQLVDAFSNLVGGPIYLASQFGAPDTQPSVSNSNGGSNWLITWTRSDPVYHGDIWAARLRYDGLLLNNSFGVTTFGLGYDSAPCASSPLSQTGFNARNMIAFQRRPTPASKPDIYVSVVEDASLVQTLNLTALENAGTQALEQVDPAVDSNGHHFVVTYSEPDPVFLQYDVYAADLHLAGNQIGLSQGHVELQSFGLSERRSRVSAQHAWATNNSRFLAMYDFEQNSTDHDIAGNLFDSVPGGTWSSFCFGDGSSGACPCGNTGHTGHGCANSSDAYGGVLVLTGTPSTLADTVQLHLANVGATTTCLLFQGVPGAPAVLGDGLLCAQAPIVRLKVLQASGGSATFPTAGDPPLSQMSSITTAGGSRSYQVWYRDTTASFCPTANFNLSNGVKIEWAR